MHKRIIVSKHDSRREVGFEIEEDAPRSGDVERWILSDVGKLQASRRQSPHVHRFVPRVLDALFIVLCTEVNLPLLVSTSNGSLCASRPRLSFSHIGGLPR